MTGAKTLLYVTKLTGRWNWHIAAHKPSGYGVRVLCGPSFAEGQYRMHGPGVASVCKSCRRISERA